MVDVGVDDSDREALDLLLRGFQVSCMLRAVAEVGIADALPLDGGASIEGLAATCQVLPEPLLRMVRALAAFGVFQLGSGATVQHTRLSRLLRADAPNSMHHGARFWTSPGAWGAWGKLEAALRGDVPHQAAWNTDRFGYLREHQDEMALFDAMMAHFPDNRHAAIAEAYDFSRFKIIADLGGGNGATLRQILAQAPQAQGLLFDQAQVVGQLGQMELLDGRISTSAGSFFETVPRGADVYMLVRVLHDWSDSDCVRILKTCRRAMTPTSVLLIGEHLLQPDPLQGRPTDYLTDMQMMAMFGSARQRSEQELQPLLGRSGFELVRVVETASPVALLEIRTA